MICEICGNENDQRKSYCFFCGSKLKKIKIKKTVKKYKTINIKNDMPRAQQANKRIEKLLWKHSESGVRVLKIIHGYGSTGKGGTVKRLVHENLIHFRSRGIVKYYVRGEEFHSKNKKGKRLVDTFPKMKNDKDYEKHNKGITLAVL